MRFPSFPSLSGPMVRSLRPSLATLAALVTAVGFADAQDSMSTLVPEAARKAVARRQEMVAKADEAAMRGSKLMADKDYQGAVSELKKALDLLPDAPVVESRRDEYTRQFADASVLLARQRAEEGRYTEAIQITEAVLQPSVDPENVAARQLLEDLNDPEIYPQAITPEHIARVKRVETALKEAASHIRIGDYDGAEKRYHEALNYDPYNSAARRGLEDVEKHRRIYYDSAYDQTRSTFLRQVESQWEMTVPRFALDRPGEEAGPTRSQDGVDYINEKLKNIVIPEIEFEDTPFSEAIEFLRQKSRELDDLEPDPTRKGVNIILRAGGGGGGGGAAPAPAAGGLGFDDPAGGAAGFGGDDASSQPISLKLSRVPLVEALRYTTELARLKYKVEPHAVVIIPITEQNADLFTQVFRVPPSFLTAGGGGEGGADLAGDPFANLGGGGGGAAKIAPKKSAKEVLEGVGVTFPPDSSAIYNPTNSQLIVRNTQQNLDLVEAYVDSLKEDVQKQIFITSKFVEVTQDNDDTFGFDWLLGQANVPGTERVFAGGGTIGNARSELNAQDFPFVQPGQSTPFGGNIITSALRSGNLAVAENSIDALLTNTIGGQTALAPALFSLAGVFTDPQFQMVLRAINQSKAADLMSAPSVVARSGEVARLEVIREFIYPTEYDPPEIPQQFGAIGGVTGGGLLGGSNVSSFPVTPANPTAFEQRNVGVTLETTPTIGPDGFTIDLQLNPEVVEFEGFINYGSPIFSGGTNNAGQPVQVLLTENRIEMPVFATRRVTTGVTIWDGQTVAIGGLMREDIQHVQDKLPFLGDLPFAGFLFRMESEVREKRNLTIFVTARLIDPSGAPINDDVTGAVQVAPAQ